MKASLAMTAAAALAFASASVLAGEDSTDRWGAGGTGLPYYETNCGLHNFPGPTDDAKAQRPCGYAGSQQDVAARRAVTPAQASAPAAAGQTQPASPQRSAEKDR